MSDVRSINCTQCGAPLELHGGHKVRSLNCQYCGASMDAQAGYKVVQQFKKTIRPECPLNIGMKGVIKDVEFTIIGLIQYKADGVPWVELQLYSPTHGYHWLSYEDGHFVFNRRTRDLPVPKQVKNFRVKSKISLGKQKYRLYEQYTAKISYVEGELTWVAKQGQKLQITEAIAPPLSISYEETNKELEYFCGEYLGANTVYDTFKVEPKDRNKLHGVHCAQPYDKNKWLFRLGKIAGYFAWINFLILFIVMGIGQGDALIKTHFDYQYTQPKVIDFKIEEPDHLLELKLDSSSMRNNWATYDVVISQNNKDIFYLSKEISFYEGYDGGEHWSEGSRTASALFKLPAAGIYQLKIVSEEGSNKQTPPVFVELYEDVMAERYFVMLFLLCLLFVAFRVISRWSFEAKRWAPVTEDD